MLPKALKNCPKSKRSPNLVTLPKMDKCVLKARQIGLKEFFLRDDCEVESEDTETNRNDKVQNYLDRMRHSDRNGATER